MGDYQRRCLELGMKLVTFDVLEFCAKKISEEWAEASNDKKELDLAASHLTFHVMPPLVHPGEKNEFGIVSRIFLVKVESLAMFDHLPKFEELQKQNLVEPYCPDFQLPSFAFVSHKWFGHGEPDSTFRSKHRYLVGLKASEGIEYIWMDYCCIPQDSGSRVIAEEVEKLDHLLHLADRVIPMSFDHRAYLRSGWCMLEGLVGGVEKVRVLDPEESLQKVAARNEDWELEVDQLTFGNETDAPMVLIKSLNSVYLETDRERRKNVCDAIRLTLDKQDFKSFAESTSKQLVTMYQQKINDIIYKLKQNFDTYAAAARFLKKLSPRKVLHYEERAAFQVLMRTPFCVHAYSHPGVTAVTDELPDPQLMITQMKLPDPFIKASNEEDGNMANLRHQVDPVNMFMSRLVPQSIKSSPYNNMLNLCDFNSFATLEEICELLYFLGFRSIGVDRWAEMIAGVWTDTAGNDNVEFDFRRAVSQVSGPYFQILVKSDEDRLPSCIDCERSTVPLSKMDMHTKPYLVWKSCNESDDAMKYLLEAPHVRAYCMKTANQVNKFNLVSADTVINCFTAGGVRGWSRFNTMLAAAYGLKMSVSQLDQVSTEDETFPEKVLLWVLINWINPHDGLKSDTAKIMAKVGTNVGDRFTRVWEGCEGILDIFVSMAYICGIEHKMRTTGSTFENESSKLMEPLLKWTKPYLVQSRKRAFPRLRRQIYIPKDAMKHIRMVTEAKIASESGSVGGGEGADGGLGALLGTLLAQRNGATPQGGEDDAVGTAQGEEGQGAGADSNTMMAALLLRAAMSSS